jgi:hypothetical protein
MSILLTKHPNREYAIAHESRNDDADAGKAQVEV